MDLTVIILNYNTKDLLMSCLDSIVQKKWQHSIKVMVVDNCSVDDSVITVRKHFSQVSVIESNQNLGFTRGNNLGLKEVKSKYALLLNSDTEVLEGSLDKLIDFMDKTDYGIASCRLVDGEGNFQPNSGQLPTFFPMFTWLSGLDDILNKMLSVSSYQARDNRYYLKDREVGWVSGSAMIIRSEVWHKIGYLDEKIFMYGEDVEYCLRAKREGFKVGWTNGTQIIHLGGKSSSQPQYNQWRGEFKGLLYIYKKYYGLLAALGLKVLIYLFVILRAGAFFILGKTPVSKTYVKIIFSL